MNFMRKPLVVYARNKQQLISAEPKGELRKLNYNELRAQTTSLKKPDSPTLP